MAKHFGSNRQTIKRILNLDLHKRCYRKISVQDLKEDQKPERKICCQWIRKNIDRSKVERLMFNAKRLFTRNGFLNPKMTLFGPIVNPMLTPVKNLCDLQSDFSATKSKLKLIDNFDYC